LHGRIIRVQDHGFPQNEISHHQDIHSRAQETIERFFGAADDWLVVVERGVHDDGHSREVAKSADQFPVERVCSAADRLEARRPVDVSGRWDSGAFLWAHAISKSHEWGGMGALEVFARGFFQN